MDGPKLESALNIKSKVNDDVKHITFDKGRNLFYGITTHHFGEIHPSSGNFQYIDFSTPAIKSQFSWPKGIAYDSENKEIVILASRNQFYFYNPERDHWRNLQVSLPSFSNIEAMTYNPEEKLFYLLNLEEDNLISTIFMINHTGANVGKILLTPKIPINSPPGYKSYYQMYYVSNKIILIVPPSHHSKQNGLNKRRIFAIDPSSGEVFVPRNQFVKSIKGSM